MTTRHKPPSNTQRFMRWDQFPAATGPETFELTSPDGQQRIVTLSKGALRVLRALLNGPLVCASPVRISDRVLILKNEYGVNIRTELFDNDVATGRQRFGVYFLDDAVRAVKSVALDGVST